MTLGGLPEDGADSDKEVQRHPGRTVVVGTAAESAGGQRPINILENSQVCKSENTPCIRAWGSMRIHRTSSEFIGNRPDLHTKFLESTVEQKAARSAAGYYNLKTLSKTLCSTKERDI